LLQLAESDADKGNMHFRLAMALQGLGIKDKNNQSFQEAATSSRPRLQLDPKLTTVRFNWGVTLARLHQDDAAHAQFSAFSKRTLGTLAA